MARESFGTKMGAVLAAAGSAVGLGNIWRFPIETGKNGGAAFVIIYLVCVVILGLPLIVSEFVIGRHTAANTAGAFRAISGGSAWKWVGRMGVFTAWIILCYYVVVGGWTLHYAFLSATNTFRDVRPADYGTLFDTFVANPWTPTICFVLFVMITHLVVTRGVRSGIERASKFLMPALLIITLCLLIGAVSLPGAEGGISFLLQPDWSKVDASVILNALGQSFYSLSIAMGCLCTYASYFDKKTPIMSIAARMAGIDTLVAVMAGFIIFPSLFNIGMTPAEAGAGPGLVFISLPNVFQQALGVGSVLAVTFSTMFYVLLFVAALTSSISLFEVATAFLVEEFHLTRHKSSAIVTASVVAVGSLCSLSFGPLSHVTLFGRTIFGVLDDISGRILLPVGGLLISVFAGWVLDRELFRDELSNHGELKVPYFKLLVFTLRYIVPIAITLVILSQLGLLDF